MGGVILGLETIDNMHRVRKYDKDAHILTVAQSGAGKNTAIVMPNLLSNTFKGTKIILDLKGENAAVCSYWKEKERLGKSYRLNPWEIFGMDTIKLNPFCLLDPYSDRLYDDCIAFAEAIIPEKPNQSDTGNHFDELARDFISSFLMFLTIENIPNPASFCDEIVLQTQSVAIFSNFCDKMLHTIHPNSYTKRALYLSAMILKGTTGAGDNGEFRGVKTTISRAHKAFRSKIMAQTVEASKEESADLIKALFDNSNDNNDLYISFPQSEMKIARVWLRLVLTAFIRDNIKNPPKHPVLFLLDEFPQLGTFNLIKDNAAFLRGYHVRFWFIAQNMAQFENNYGKEGLQTIFENCSAKQFFNVTDATAQYVFQKMGKKTVVIKDLGTNEYKSTYVEDVMSQTEVEQSNNRTML